MGSIIIGIVITIALGYLGMRAKTNEATIVLAVLTALFLVGGITVGLIAPSGKYEDVETKTIKLISLHDSVTSHGRGSLFYLNVTASNTYTYYTEIETKYAGDNDRAYVSKTIPGAKVTIVEEENCTDPRLVIYTQKAKKTFWTFAIGIEKVDNVFYVPKGSVVNEIILSGGK